MKENNSRENKVKYGHCEKATKFEKNLQPVSTLIKQRQNKWIFFSYFCGLFRKPELYTHLDQPLGLKFLLRNAVPSLQLKPGKAMVLKSCYVRLLLNWIRYVCVQFSWIFARFYVINILVLKSCYIPKLITYWLIQFS